MTGYHGIISRATEALAHPDVTGVLLDTDTSVMKWRAAFIRYANRSMLHVNRCGHRVMT